MATTPTQNRADELIAVATSLANESLRPLDARRSRRSARSWGLPVLVISVASAMGVGVVIGLTLRSRTNLEGSVLIPSANAAVAALSSAPSAPSTIPAPATTSARTTTSVAPVPLPATTTIPSGPPLPARFTLEADGKGHVRGAFGSTSDITALVSEGEEVLGEGTIVATSAYVDPRVTLSAAELEHLDLSAEVFFTPGLAGLDPQQSAVLDRVVLVLALRPDTTIAIEGHSDSLGPDDENLSLTGSRARRAAEYLIGQGVDPDRIVEIVGVGEIDPRSDNSTPEGQADNRRVDIHFVTGGDHAE